MAKKKKKAKKAGNSKPRRPASRRASLPLRRVPWKDCCGSSPPLAENSAALWPSRRKLPTWPGRPRGRKNRRNWPGRPSACRPIRDAYVILANQAASRDQARQLLEEGVAAAQRVIGSKTFETATGRFWLDQRTRPYMRALLGLAQCLWESGQRAQAVEHYAEMLRLNPNDNQSCAEEDGSCAEEDCSFVEDDCSFVKEDASCAEEDFSLAEEDTACEKISRLLRKRTPLSRLPRR